MTGPILVSPACRAFEESLAARLDAPEDISPAADPHVDTCASCRQLVEDLSVHRRLFRSLSVPAPFDGFHERLLAIPTGLAERREAEKVMALLVRGALVTPEPSKELMSRLFFLPARARQAAAKPAKANFLGKALGRFFGDWRLSVAAAYVATLLVVTLLKVDPLSVARSAATDLTMVGEHALADARTLAVDRLKDTLLARAAAPLTSRLDYRLYRTVVAGRARAAAYSQLVFEKVLGGAFEERPAPKSRLGQRNEDEAEPAGRLLRS